MFVLFISFQCEHRHVEWESRFLWFEFDKCGIKDDQIAFPCFRINAEKHPKIDLYMIFFFPSRVSRINCVWASFQLPIRSFRTKQVWQNWSTRRVIFNWLACVVGVTLGLSLARSLTVRLLHLSRRGFFVRSQPAAVALRYTSNSFFPLATFCFSLSSFSPVFDSTAYSQKEVGLDFGVEAWSCLFVPLVDILLGLQNRKPQIRPTSKPLGKEYLCWDFTVLSIRLTLHFTELCILKSKKFLLLFFFFDAFSTTSQSFKLANNILEACTYTEVYLTMFNAVQNFLDAHSWLSHAHIKELPENSIDMFSLDQWQALQPLLA